MTVIDFFCGAGGFSEGLRQEGFDIVMGVENWRPSLETHNLNHGLNDSPMDVLIFEKSVEAIELLPDTDVIVGSPPCVSFSMSNKAGKADKSLGIRLIEAYLRFVAVKKHKKGSILKAWLMENVPNSRNFVQETYTFEDLRLGKWAIAQGKKPGDIALKVKSNGAILRASDYGAPQSRDRFVCGEIVATGRFPLPKKTHGEGLKPPVTLKDIKGNMPSPNTKKNTKSYTDPNYPSLELPQTDITDHFYDTGVYLSEWRNAKFAKVNHPFMGRMSFPEAEDRPSRTIMATRSASTRESIIYKSEYGRRGNGEYRLPTIREAASLMGFPYTYRFVGGEGTKWKQIGNAVCPPMSAALARAIIVGTGGKVLGQAEKVFRVPAPDSKYVALDNYKEKVFDNPPSKKHGSRFRRHTFKDGGMTVALTNQLSAKDENPEWQTVVYVGSGKSYDTYPFNDKDHQVVTELVKKYAPGFVSELKKLGIRPAKSSELQEAYERQIGSKDLKEPTELVDGLSNYLFENFENDEVSAEKLPIPLKKSTVPLRQLLTMFALSTITTK